MIRKLATYLLIFATAFNVAGGYAVASTFKAASFSVCQISEQSYADCGTVIKKTPSDLVIVTLPLFKEGEEEKGQKFSFDFDYSITEIPYFLPILRAGPSASYVNLYSLAKGKNAPLFLLNCNFRI